MVKKLPDTISASTRSVWFSTLMDVATSRRAITSVSGSARFWYS